MENIFRSDLPLRIFAKTIREDMTFYLKPHITIVYVVSGEITIKFTGGSGTLHQGSFEFINSNEPYCLYSNKPNRVIFFELDYNFISRLHPKVEQVRLNCNFNYCSPVKTQEINIIALRERLDFILKCFCGSNTMSYSELAPLTTQLFTISKAYFQGINNTFLDIPHSNIYEHRYVNIFIYIVEHLHEKISLKDIATKEYLSVHHISHDFKERFGLTFYQFVTYFRVIRSLQLLLTTEDSISDISYACGFSATRYFNKSFKHYLGLTPLEFRLQNLRNKENGEAPIDLDVCKIWNDYHISRSELTSRIHYKIAVLGLDATNITVAELNNTWKEHTDYPLEFVSISSEDRLNERLKEISNLYGILSCNPIKITSNLPFLQISLWDCVAAVHQFSNHKPFNVYKHKIEEIYECQYPYVPIIFPSNADERFNHFPQTDGLLEVILLFKSMFCDNWNMSN